MEERIHQAHKMFSAWKHFIELRKEDSLPVPFDLQLWLAKECEGLLFFFFLVWMFISCECGKKAELHLTCRTRFC